MFKEKGKKGQKAEGQEVSSFISKTTRPQVSQKQNDLTMYCGLNLSTPDLCTLTYLDTSLFNLNKPIFLACIYMQPNRTSAENHKFNENLREKISSFCDYGDIILRGDFNARTSRLQVYIADDEFKK